MNVGYDAFFKVLNELLIKNKIKIPLYGPQFDEICNVKKKHPYKSPKSRSARCALSRIENLQKNNLLYIEPLNLDSERGAYADPLIIKLILKFLKKGSRVSFLTKHIIS